MATANPARDRRERARLYRKGPTAGRGQAAGRTLLLARVGSGRPRRGLAELPLVLRQDRALHALARLGVERVRDVLEGAVLAALRGHRHEQAGVPVDDLEVADHEAA